MHFLDYMTSPQVGQNPRPHCKVFHLALELVGADEINRAQWVSLRKPGLQCSLWWVRWEPLGHSQSLTRESLEKGQSVGDVWIAAGKKEGISLYVKYRGEWEDEGIATSYFQTKKIIFAKALGVTEDYQCNELQASPCCRMVAWTTRSFFNLEEAVISSFNTTNQKTEPTWGFGSRKDFTTDKCHVWEMTIIIYLFNNTLNKYLLLWILCIKTISLYFRFRPQKESLHST